MNSHLTRTDTDFEFDDMVCRITAHFEQGATPRLEVYQRHYPQFAERLERLWPTLQAVAELGHFQDGPRLSASTETRRGTLGDFEIIREIGRGGMGVVYEAEQISLNRRVALKVLPFAAVLNPTQLQRFKNEAHIAAHLTHQHIVPVYAVGCERSVHFYAMQYIEGRTLADVIMEHSGEDVQGDKKANDKLPVECHSEDDVSAAPTADEPAALIDTRNLDQQSTLGPEPRCKEYYDAVATLIIQAADALQYAHDKDVVHRDVKPSNLILDEQGGLWVADFGLAYVNTEQSLTMTGDLVGTLRYMSPEQAAGDRAGLDHRTDIYSLGITAYELLAGQPAFAGNDRQSLFREIEERDPIAPRSVRAKIPVDLETIVLKAIRKDPDDRYATMSEFKTDLQSYLDDQPILARRASVVRRARRWCRQNPLAAMLAATVLLLVTVAGFSLARWAQLPTVFQPGQSLSLREVAANVKFVGDVSPSGQKLALTNWNTGNVAALDLISGEQRDVTKAGSWDADGIAQFNEGCVWSPDGKQLAYQWILPESLELRVISEDGTERRTLMRKEKLRFLHPYSWSADGRYVLVGQQYGYQRIDLTLLDVNDESEQVLLTLSEPRPDSAQLSPSGRYVAWARRTSNNSERDIFVLDIQTQTVVCIEEAPANDMFPEWTPDGRWIVFVSDRGGGRGLWAIRWLNGQSFREPRFICELTGQVVPLGITRAGSYYFARANTDRDLFHLRLDLGSGALVGEVSRLPTSLQGVNLVGAYSNDGKRLAWLSTPQSGRDMAILSIRDLTHNETQEFPVRTTLNGIFVGGYSLQWMPTGDAVIIRGGDGSGTHYFRMDVATGHISRYLPDLFDPIGDSYAFSRDGRHIYFVGSQSLEHENGGIFRLDVQSHNKVRLHPLRESHQFKNFGLSPSGEQLAFSTEKVLHALPSMGGEARVIHQVAEDRQFARSSLVWATDDSILAGIAPSSGQPVALWQFFTDGRPARPLGMTSREIATPKLHPNGSDLLYASASGNSFFKVWKLDNLTVHLSALE